MSALSLFDPGVGMRDRCGLTDLTSLEGKGATAPQTSLPTAATATTTERCGTDACGRRPEKPRQPAPPGQPAQRLYSTVRREQRDGAAVYVKELIPGPYHVDAATLRARCDREASVIRRLGECESLRGELGCLELVAHEPDLLRIVTRSAPGRPLHDALFDPAERIEPENADRGVAAAGRWIRTFQSLAVRGAEALPIGEQNPLDIHDYCDFRLRRLQAAGYRWLSESRRAALLGAVDRLLAAADHCDRAHVWSHRDYHPGNMLWDGKVLTAIDFATAGLDVPLSDVTYFLFRLEMQKVYRPWRRWPIDRWKRAFLRGYGRPDAGSSPMYRLLMIRHHLCRLLSYATRPPRDSLQKAHDGYVRMVLRRRLARLCKL